MGLVPSINKNAFVTQRHDIRPYYNNPWAIPPESQEPEYQPPTKSRKIKKSCKTTKSHKTTRTHKTTRPYKTTRTHKTTRPHKTTRTRKIDTPTDTSTSSLDVSL